MILCINNLAMAGLELPDAPMAMWHRKCLQRNVGDPSLIGKTASAGGWGTKIVTYFASAAAARVGGDLMMAEKFSVPELAALRSELLQSGLDSRDAAELLQVFLAGRGFGVSPDVARDAMSKVEGSGCSLEVIGRELDRIALLQ